MAAKDKGAAASAKPKASKGHPFLWGMVLGVLLGVFAGWWFPPPGFLHFGEIKQTTEQKVQQGATDLRRSSGRAAEDLGRKLQQ